MACPQPAEILKPPKKADPFPLMPPRCLWGSGLTGLITPPCGITMEMAVGLKGAKSSSAALLPSVRLSCRQPRRAPRRGATGLRLRAARGCEDGGVTTGVSGDTSDGWMAVRGVRVDDDMGLGGTARAPELARRRMLWPSCGASASWRSTARTG